MDGRPGRSVKGVAMHNSTDEKKPAGDSNPTAGSTDHAILPNTASASKMTGNKTGARPLDRLHNAINRIILRAWCAAPSSWSRGTIHPGASHTKSEAADLPDSEVFSRPEFMVLDVGSAYPQGRRQRFGAVTTPHIHSVALVRHGMALVTPEGAKTMTTSPVASRSAAPTTTPTTGNTHIDSTSEETRAFALLQASSDATMAKLYLANGNVPAARRKAVQLLKALQGLSKFGRAAVATSPCTGCAQNFPLPAGELDFFDAQVVRGYIELRTACTERAGAAKPCLKGGA
jgi:hypothetical protein